jgi:hypothetical protein
MSRLEEHVCAIDSEGNPYWKPLGEAAAGVVEKTLEVREHTHGDFSKTATIAQGIKSLVTGTARGREPLTCVQAEALEMIATKLARIASGNANEPDHWHDIAGYAQLAARELDHGRR